MKRVLCFCFLVLDLISFSQNNEMNELRERALKVDKDSAASCYSRMAYLGTMISPDTVRFYAYKVLAIASKKKPSYGDALIQIGNSFAMNQKNDSAIFYYNKARVFYEANNFLKGIAKAEQSFAVIYRNTEEFAKSNVRAKAALEIYKKLNWSVGIINVYNLLSGNYWSKNNLDSSVLYNRLALGLAAQNKADSSKYFQVLMDYAYKLKAMNKVDSAMKCFAVTSNFMERNQYFNSVISLETNMAMLYLTVKGQEDFPGARTHLNKALRLSKQYNIKENYKLILDYYLSSYILESNRKDSIFKYLTEYQKWIDTLNTKEQDKYVKEIGTKYETEKKDLQIKNQSLEISTKEKENEAKNKLLMFGAVGLFAIAIFAFFAFSNYKKAKKANVIINSQKSQVELQNEEIKQQKNIVEEKQKEILDSIHYAKKIQTAVLTSELVWNKISPEHYIIFLPKDIVSGDFYWAYNTPNNRSIFALADCTGHGVPGGFMSMLGNSFLNELVVENKIFKSDEVLNKLRAKIISSLEQKGNKDQRDGMDMAICVWNKLTNTLEFSGANNNFWLIRNNELTQYSGDKMPIGNYSDNAKPFSSQQITLQKNDLIILSTDGFADQFGGTGSKKLMTKNLKRLLVDISSKKMEAQKEELLNFLSAWKGNNQQVDDISLIAIKVV